MKKSMRSTKVKTFVSFLCLYMLAVFLLPVNAQASGLVDQAYLDSIVDDEPNPLPRYATPNELQLMKQAQKAKQVSPEALETMESTTMAASTGLV